MRDSEEDRAAGSRRFFRLAHGEGDLVAFYDNFYGLVRHHGYSEHGILSMIPWELEIVTMLAVQANEAAKNK